MMNRQYILEALAEQRGRLASEFGVRSLALFGSFARDEAVGGSDIDLLVEFDRPTGYFGLVRLQLYLERAFGCPVDVLTPGGLKDNIRSTIQAEAIHVN